MLASLPEIQRKQWLEGNWDVYEGVAFPEFRRDLHVLDTFSIPSNWPKFRACDWGYSSPACCLWFAIDYDNNLIVYRELYGKGLTADVFALKVLALEAKDNIKYGILDMSTWAKRGDVGPSIAETMIRLGCSWRPSDRSPNSRISGKLEVHRRLASVDNSKPKLQILSTCTNLIRTLPALPLDKNDIEDVDTDAEDHAYDALRYGCMSRPLSVGYFEQVLKHSKEQFSPFDQTFGY